MHNADVSKLPQFVETLRELKPDGVLIADPGVFEYVREHAPELNRFVSTQANICSSLAVKFWQNQGAKLCVLGREVSFSEMKQIRSECPDILLECFMHGAMCMSYSGRCLISNYLADRSANQGKCAHCCRWHYKLHLRLKDGSVKEIEINENNKDAFEFLLEEEFRPGEYFEVIEDEHGGYILNSKDMCLMPRLNELLEIGIDSLKVEGRNKTEYYTGVVARAYRRAIDDYYKSPQDWDYRQYMDDLYTLQNRGYCLGFHDGKLTNVSQNYEYTRTLGDWLFAGSIVEWQGDDAVFEIRNYINPGEFIEFLIPGTLENIRLTLNEFEDAESGEFTARVSAGQGKKSASAPRCGTGQPQKSNVCCRNTPLHANPARCPRKMPLCCNTKKRVLPTLRKINVQPISQQKRSRKSAPLIMLRLLQRFKPVALQNLMLPNGKFRNIILFQKTFHVFPKSAVIAPQRFSVRQKPACFEPIGHIFPALETGNMLFQSLWRHLAAITILPKKHNRRLQLL